MTTAEMRTNYEEVINQLTKDASSLIGATVKSLAYGKGEITGISMCETSGIVDIAAKIKFEATEKTFCLKLATVIRAITFENPEIFNALIPQLDAINKQCAELKSAELTDKMAKIDEERAAAKEAERIKKLLAKREQQKKDAIKSAQALSLKTPLKVNDFYFCLGWITKHVKKISAAMPDYLGSWFESEFGVDAEKRLVDSNKLTPSGLPSQFALSMTIDLDTNESIPASLTKYLSEANKEIRPISRTEFVYDLVKNHGFKFGKTQDVDEITKYISSDNMDSFLAGMAN